MEKETHQKLEFDNQGLKQANSKLTARVAELEQSNAEKDILFNEVHHRVNNNLQVIASLLRMQAQACPDNRVADALRESQLRVESMGLIHAQLYNSVDWRTVDFAGYTSVLAGNLFRSYGVDSARIQWQVKIDGPLELSVDKAIPAGLILNELISNSLKHAFPDGRHGSVLIEGRLHNGRVDLAVHDDGVGIPRSTAPQVHQSLGLKIVNILCRQLKGNFGPPDGAAETGPGSTFRISFPHTTTPVEI